MAIYIEKLMIDHFKGINNLKIDELNHINIIAGDNNTGKTSVLEALLFLRNPSDFNNILRISRMRDLNSFFSSSTLYDSFINIFPKDITTKTISIEAMCKGKNVICRLEGDQKKIMVDPEDILKKMSVSRRNNFIRNMNSDFVEIESYNGVLSSRINGISDRAEVQIASYETTSGREINQKNFLDIIYLSPTEHVRGYVINSILRNDSYKEICLHILQLFDVDIVDLFMLRNEENNRPIEYIKHRILGNMPISTYGDGIKKVLSIANGIAQATGGVLLIDEIETAIHSKYYEDIFQFLVKAALQFDVQVFVSTHSIEAIDGLLSTQDYLQQQKEDNISVITFKKDLMGKDTFSRVLAGRHVFKNREQFGFEVRL